MLICKQSFPTIIARYLTLKGIKNAVTCKPPFRRRSTFLSKLDLLEAIYLTTFQILVVATLMFSLGKKAFFCRSYLYIWCFINMCVIFLLFFCCNFNYFRLVVLVRPKKLLVLNEKIMRYWFSFFLFSCIFQGVLLFLLLLFYRSSNQLICWLFYHPKDRLSFWVSVKYSLLQPPHPYLFPLLWYLYFLLNLKHLDIWVL